MNLTHRTITPKDTSRKNQKLRDSAKDAPYCFGCWKPNPNGDSLCLAHSNLQKDGKGRGLKARDDKGAILCAKCHAYVDGGGESREAMQNWHEYAHRRTLAWWRSEGYLK